MAGPGSPANSPVATPRRRLPSVSGRLAGVRLAATVEEEVRPHARAGVGVERMRVRDTREQLPIRSELLHPRSEGTVPLVLAEREILVARADQHEPFSGVEQVVHVGREDLIFDQMEDHLLRQRKIGSHDAGSIDEVGRVVAEEALGPVPSESFGAP